MIAFGNLSRKQEQALTALLTYPSILEAAQHCGTTEVTLHRWLKQEAFQTTYREARRQIVQHVITRVQQVAGEAVETLREVMQDGNTPAGARIQAAKALLELSVRAVEVEDFGARLTDL